MLSAFKLCYHTKYFTHLYFVIIQNALYIDTLLPYKMLYTFILCHHTRCFIHLYIVTIQNALYLYTLS